MNILTIFFTKKIKIETNNNQTLIDIKEKCTLKEFTIILKKTKYSKLLNDISLEHLIDTTTINPKKILIINEKNITYIIYYTQETIIITKTEIKKHIIKQTINIDKTNSSYQISSTINNLYNNKKEIKAYPKNETKNCESISLEKKEALSIASTILEELAKLENIYLYISINDILNILNIILDKNYYPLISNDRITLSWPNRYGQNDINKKTRCSLDIILNKTREKIGTITFNYMNNNFFSYSGNISYTIKKEFQNNHFATEALSLLKELLKSHEHKGNKDLFIATSKENIRSQKVALNNNGKLIYDGKVPKTNLLSRNSGITQVKIYQIKI